MAPFNKRQIGYIQAIAGRQQHRTLICGSKNDQISSGSSGSTPDEKPPNLMANFVTGTGYGGTHASVKSLLMYNWSLDDPELGFDSRTVQNNDRLEPADFTDLYDVTLGQGHNEVLNVFDAPVVDSVKFDTDGHVVHADHAGAGVPLGDKGGMVAMNPDAIASTWRASPDGFLNSTNVRFRFTLPRVISDSGPTNHTMGQDHYEFRWIVWRSKRPTLHLRAGDVASVETNLEQIRNGCSFRHPGYDFWMGQTGRKRGLLGYTHNRDLDKDFGMEKNAGVISDTERYSGYRWNGSAFTTGGTLDNRTQPVQEEPMTVDDLMTCRINKEDYVVMKDVRFFLGKEHGKSHFEDTLHWDWNDPIDAQHTNVLTSPTLNDKNYRWHFTLIGTSGGDSDVKLNTSVRWTTKMESG